jgi:hypothetical protein
MKRLIVLIGVFGLLVAGAAMALANDDGPPVVALQDADDPDVDDQAAPVAPGDRRMLLGEVLEELVDEGVISEAQADVILERIAEKRDERGLDELRGFHHFRFPEGFELPEGFDVPEHFEFRFPEGLEFPDDFELRGPIEIPEALRDQLDELMETLEDELGLHSGGRMFRFPGGTLRDFLDDGELSQDELDQIESELRDLAEEFREHLERRLGNHTNEAPLDA